MIECLARKAAASSAEGGEDGEARSASAPLGEGETAFEGAEEDSAEFEAVVVVVVEVVEASSFRLRFFSFLSALDSEVLGSAVSASTSRSSCFRFFFFFFSGSSVAGEAATHRNQ